MSIRKKTILPLRTIRNTMTVLGIKPTKAQTIFVTKLIEAFMLHLMEESKGLRKEKILRCIRKNKYYFLEGIEDEFKGILQQEMDEINETSNTIENQQIITLKNSQDGDSKQLTIKNTSKENDIEANTSRYTSDMDNEDSARSNLRDHHFKHKLDKDEQLTMNITNIHSENKMNETVQKNIFSHAKSKFTQITDDNDVEFILDSDNDD